MKVKGMFSGYTNWR